MEVRARAGLWSSATSLSAQHLTQTLARVSLPRSLRQESGALRDGVAPRIEAFLQLGRGWRWIREGIVSGQSQGRSPRSRVPSHCGDSPGRPWHRAAPQPRHPPYGRVQRQRGCSVRSCKPGEVQNGGHSKGLYPKYTRRFFFFLNLKSSALKATKAAGKLEFTVLEEAKDRVCSLWAVSSPHCPPPLTRSLDMRQHDKIFWNKNLRKYSPLQKAASFCC